MRDHDIKMKVGKRIKRLRMLRKATQEQLAAAAEIDYKYLQTIEGKNPPNIKVETLAKIARGLRVPIIKLFEF